MPRPEENSDNDGVIERVLHVVGRTRLAGTAQIVDRDPDFVVLIDRDARGRVIRETGYPPHKALRQGLFLIREAVRRDPHLRGAARDGLAAIEAALPVEVVLLAAAIAVLKEVRR